MFDFIIGLGQGGSRIASSFEERFSIPALYVNFSGVDFSKFKPEGKKIIIETGGTGRDPDFGEKLAIKNKEEITTQLTLQIENSEVNDILVCVGGGGGSGCGLMKVVIPFLLKKKKRLFLIYTLPEKKEKLPAKPNSLKVLNSIINEFIKEGLISVLLVDNEYSCNKYTSEDFHFAGINKALPKAFNRFFKITNLHDKHNYLDFASGYNALDLNELKRVLFYSLGFCDIRIFSLDEDSINDEMSVLRNKIKTSSLFMGSFDINTSKIALCSISIPEKLKQHQKINSFIDTIFDIVGKMTKAPLVFNSSYFDKSINNISVNILVNGLTKSKALDSLISQAIKDKLSLDNKEKIGSLDLGGLFD